MNVESFCTGDGCRIAYRFDGPDEAPVLLLSNSLGTDMAMWEPQLSRFAARFRVLRYDSRGHGASDVPSGAYSLDRLGRDAVELLDALAIERVDFCGLSLGGMVGQWLGIREPGRLRRLVLANTSSFMGPPADWDQRIATVRQNGMSIVAEASMMRWFTDEFRATEPEAMARIRSMLLATDPAGYAGCCAAIRDMDLRRVVSVIHTPTLVIGGTLDPATPPTHVEVLASAVARARLALIQAAHLSNLEVPAQFTRACLDFLR